VGKPSLSRALSLPQVIGSVADIPTPVALFSTKAQIIENLSNQRLKGIGSKKKFQQWRVSLSVTNSDYYSQWRPNISSLAMLHGSSTVRSIPRSTSHGTIAEGEYQDKERGIDAVDQPVHLGTFHYTPSQALEEFIHDDGNLQSLGQNTVAYSSGRNTKQVLYCPVSSSDNQRRGTLDDSLLSSNVVLTSTKRPSLYVSFW